MPYIITTKQQRPVALVTGDSPAYDVISRRAVATLEEIYSAGILGRGVVLPESGGTVGPLPDGTLIDVERIARRAFPDGWPVKATRT